MTRPLEDGTGTTSAAADEPLASVEEVTALIAATVEMLPAASLPLAEAAGRVLAEAVRAPMPLPRFDNAAMDGYAVRTADVAGATVDAPVTLRLVAPSVAGQAMPPRLPAGCACPIATGAYRNALYVISVIMLVSAIIPFIVRPPLSQQEAAAEEAEPTPSPAPPRERTT